MENNIVRKVLKNCGKIVKRIVWKKGGKEYFEKSVKKMWKTITWKNCGKTVKKIVWKSYVKKNSMGKVWKSCDNNSVKKMWKKIAREKCGKISGKNVEKNS